MRRRLATAVLVLATATAAAAQPLAAPAPGQPDAEEHQAAPADGLTRNEPSVAVSPRDPRRVATAANTLNGDYYIGVNVSRDGGRSYRQHRMPQALGGSVQGDPHLAFDARGRLYALYMSFARGNRGIGGLALARSDDGGETWPRRPFVVSRNTRAADGCTYEDFPALAVDPRPGSQLVYVAWQRITYTGADCATASDLDVLVSRSRDGGRTWSAPLPLETPAGVTDPYIPSIDVGRDGTVVVTTAANRSGFSDCPSSLGPLASTVAVSRDQAREFESSVAQKFCVPGTPAYLQEPVFRSYVNSYTGASYRLLANTNTVVNPRTRRLVNVVGGQDPVTGQQRVYVATSGDGRSWARGGAVPASPEENQQYPRLAVGANGHLSLLYLAQLPGGLLQASHTTSKDDGRTWSPVQRLTGAPSRIMSPGWLGFIGDYLGNAVGSDGLAHPVWTDVRQSGAAPGSSYGGTIYTRAVGT